MTVKASRIMSMTTWFALLTMVTPYTILMLVSNKSRPSTHSTCDHLLNKHAKTLFEVNHGFAFIVFLSVLFSLTFFYYSASRRVLQVQLRQLGSSNSKRLLKSRRNMLVLVTVFCICFVPYHVVRLLQILLRRRCSGVWYYVKEVAILISILNICLDPLIYVFLCKDFRDQLNLKQIFCTKENINISSLEARETENQLNTINNRGELLGQ